MPSPPAWQTSSRTRRILLTSSRVGLRQHPAGSCTAGITTERILGALEAIQNRGTGKLVGNGLSVVNLVVPRPRPVPLIDIRAIGADLEVHNAGPASRRASRFDQGRS